MKVNLRKEARGRECTMRIPCVCNWDPETTVLCHLDGAGMALKSDDRHAAIGCSSCHDATGDNTQRAPYSKTELKLMFLEGVIRTQQIWIKEGKM